MALETMYLNLLYCRFVRCTTTVGGKLAHWLRSAHCEGLDILSHGTYLGCFEFEYRKLQEKLVAFGALAQIKGGMMTIGETEKRKSKTHRVETNYCSRQEEQTKVNERHTTSTRLPRATPR